jgi:glutamate-1-semialdehyde 2,1-aminomutase
VRAGSILWLALQEGEPPLRFEDIRPESAETYATLHGALLERGVSLAPSAYEVMFVSLAHDPAVIKETVEAFESAVKAIT